MTYGRVAAVCLALTLGWFTGTASSWAHGVGSPSLSEQELRQVETRVLGAEHAAEHARQRRIERTERARWLRLNPADRHRRLARRKQSTRRLVARVATTTDPATDGRWSGQVKIPVTAVHAALLPTGKVIWFSRPDADGPANEAMAYLWDPSKPLGDPAALRRVDPPVNPDTGRAANIWCAGQSLLSDGQLLVTGGNLGYASSGWNYKGLQRVYTFDPWSETWTEQPRMAQGRWYPTQTLLPDGRTMIVAGLDETGAATNRDIEVFTPPAIRGGRGTVTKVGEYGPSLPGSPAAPRFYPHWFVMPSGRLLNAGPGWEESWVLDLLGGTPRSADRPSWKWTHTYGTGVLLPGGPTGSTRVAQIGGYGPDGAAIPVSEVFDEARPGTAPVAADGLIQARAHHNTVLLPDGSMVTVGGGYGNREGDLRASGPEHLPIEIWNPETGSWRLGPAQAHKRAYHSTALLLPDGRVVSAGDDLDPTKDPDRQTDVAELYEPAYLFAPGPRPSITAAPASVAFDQSFSIGTSSPITRATLVSPGATTHANDMHQRHVELRIRPTATGADLVAPPNGNIAPPGQYMLFGLSATGKPSVARWITIGGAPPAPGDPAPPPGGAPVPPSDQGTPPVTDHQPPRISLLGVSRDLRRAARRGVRLRLRADEPATLSVALTIGRATARRLGVAHDARSAVTVGRRFTALRAGVSRLHVAPRRSARRAMRRVRRIKLNIGLVATDAAGNTSRRVRTVTLKR